LTQVLSEGGFRVEATAGGHDALAAADEALPALAILEIKLPDICGYEVSRALRERHGDALAIMFISEHRKEATDRVAGFLLGADDYMGKPIEVAELLVRCRALTRRVGSRMASTASANGRGGLTERELEVLRLLADGLDQATIASRLFITAKTVGKHIEHILRKLPARSRAEAVSIAYRRGLQRPPTAATAS
jgi:DNA-binding NarL/FixJ family response regulator